MSHKIQQLRTPNATASEVGGTSSDRALVSCEPEPRALRRAQPIASAYLATLCAATARQRPNAFSKKATVVSRACVEASAFERARTLPLRRKAELGKFGTGASPTPYGLLGGMRGMVNGPMRAWTSFGTL